MKMTLEISGMMCPRCEKHVQKGLLALDGVQSVTASHASGTATLKTDKQIPEPLLRETIAALGYECRGIR